VKSVAVRLGVIGAGRVFERLYRPALARVAQLELVAACDVTPPEQALPPGVRFDASIEAMVGAGGLDAVAVLTPPRLHAEHAAKAIAAGLRVLVEKPVTMDLGELRNLLQVGTGGDLVPAFPRRYWPAYQALGSDLRRLELETNPPDWGARTAQGEHPAFDLLPHLADLACLARGEAPVAVNGEQGESAAEADLRFADGSSIRCRAAHGPAYREWFATTEGPRRVGPPGPAASLRQRVRREPAVDVLGMTRLLDHWASGDAGVPGAEDAWNSVAIVDAFWRSLESGKEEPVEGWPGEGVSRGGAAPRGDR
jgi:predicted dehydrogenase